MSRGDDIMDRYLHRTDTAKSANHNDAQFSMQVKWLRNMLHFLDIAMDDEGVPEKTRVRVLRTVLYGTTEDPADAQLRMTAHTSAASDLAATEIVFPVGMTAEQVAEWISRCDKRSIPG